MAPFKTKLSQNSGTFRDSFWGNQASPTGRTIMRMTRIKLIALASALLLGMYALSWAAYIPQLFNFQGRVTDENGRPRNGTVQLGFRLYTTVSGGTQIWEETYPSAQIVNGVVVAQLGTLTPIPISVFSDNTSIYLATVINGTELAPRQQLLSVPYAFAAETVRGSGSVSASTAVFTGWISASSATIRDLTVSSLTATTTGGNSENVGLRVSSSAYLATSGGLLGIGTIAPEARLHLSGNGGQTLLIKPSVMAGGSNRIQFVDPDNGTLPMNIVYYDDGSPRLSIEGGYLGVIGDIVITGKVDGVDVSDLFTNINLSTATLTTRTNNLDLSTAAISSYMLSLSASTTTLGLSTAALNLTANNTNYINVSGSIQTKAGGLNVIGNIGIGTANPTSKLDVWAGSITVRGTNAGLHIADPQTSPSNRNLIQVSTNSNIAFVVNDIGRVGIGTASPTQQLHVSNGTILVEPASGNSGLSIQTAPNTINHALWINSTGGPFISAGVEVGGGSYNPMVSSGDNRILFGDNSSAAGGGNLVIAPWSSNPFGLKIMGASGKVGVGTALPGATLDVAGSINASSASFTTTGTNSENVGLRVSSSAYLATSGGFVGIGTTNPGSTLQVIKGINQQLTLPITVGSGFYESGSAAGIGFMTDGAPHYTKGALVYESNATGWNLGRFHFLLRSDVSQTPVSLTDAKLTILESGNVGIGTSNPANDLEVIGGITASSITLSGLTGSDPAGPVAGSLIYRSDTGQFKAKTPAGWVVLSTASVASDTALDTTASTQTKTGGLVLNGGLATNGMIGVGTLSPGYQLDVRPGLLYLGKNDDAFEGGEMVFQGAPSYDEMHFDSYQNNLRMFTTSGNNNYLDLNNNGAGSFGLTVEGNVGIGTINPNSKLHVKGSSDTAIMYLQPTNWDSSGDFGEIRFGDSNHFIQGEYLNGMTFFDINQFRFMGGNVGIGTINPQAVLDVNGSNAVIGRVNGNMLVEVTNDSGIGILRVYNGGATSVQLNGYGTSWITGGSLGIGTVSPGARLHVFNSAGSNGPHLNVSTGSTKLFEVNGSSVIMNGSLNLLSPFRMSRGMQLRWGDDAESTDDSNIVVTQDGSDITNMRFRLGDAADPADNFIFERGNLSGGSGPELMRISASGNVGIGTIDPLEQLHVFNGSGNAGIILAGAAGAQSRVSFRSGTTETAVLYRPVSSSDLRLYTPTAGDIMTWTNVSGNVGIGSTGPAQKLDVVGNIAVSGTVDGVDVSDLSSWVGGSSIKAVGNFGQWDGHATYTSFNQNVNQWGWNFVQGNTNGPSASSAQWYRFLGSIGSEYSALQGAGAYRLELALPRFSYDNAGMWMRTMENGTFGPWVQIGSYINGSITASSASFTTTGSSSENVGLRVSSSAYLATSGGFIGIGTTAPAHKLHVSNGSIFVEPVAGNSGLDIVTTPIGTDHSLSLTSTGGPFMRIGVDSGAGSYNALVGTDDNRIIFSNGSINGGNLVIAPWSDSSHGLKIMGASGNVGIGTDNPGNDLEVIGGITASSITLSGLTGSDPAGPAAGSLIYRSDTGQFKAKTSAGWVVLSTAAVSGGTALDTSASTQTKTGGLVIGGDISNTMNTLVIKSTGLIYAPQMGIGNVPVWTMPSNNKLRVSEWVVSAQGITHNDARQLVVGPDQNPAYGLSLGYWHDGASWKSVIQNRINEAGGDIIMNPIGGNVAIGVTTASAKLHVYSDAGSTASQLLISTGSTSLLNFTGSAATFNTPVFMNGGLSWGGLSSRTETRNDAGLQGNAGAQSGFFQAETPVNYPAGASSWWHLLDVRHHNPDNNHAMQFAGSFFDQNLYFRKTNNSASTAWSQVVLANSAGNVSMSTLTVSNQLSVGAYAVIEGVINRPFVVAPHTYDGLTIGANADNQQAIQTFIDTHWVDRKEYVPGANTLQLQPDVGVVGIGMGTVTPSYALDVYGTFRSTSTTILAANNGNVGIGTTNPSHKLTVGNGSGALLIDGANVGLGLELKDEAGFSTIQSWGSSQDLALNPAGNYVGIGISTPSATLHINGAAGDTGHQLIISTGTTTIFAVTGSSVSFNGNIGWNSPWINADFSGSTPTYSSYGGDWQSVQYRKVGDIVYLRGLAVKSGDNINNFDIIFRLPVGFRPPSVLAFVSEPHNGLTTKHRIDISADGEVKIGQIAGVTIYASFDGIFFSITP